MKRLLNFVPAISLAAAMLGLHPAVAAANAVTVVATVHGGGTANMTDVVAAGFKGVSSFGFNATLFADGSARGHFDCVDHMGDPPGYPGNIFGDITQWDHDAYGNVRLYVTGTFVSAPTAAPGRTGGVVPVSFTVTIQQFGGAGV